MLPIEPLVAPTFQKATDLSGNAQMDLTKMSLCLNQDPRKVLVFTRQKINFDLVSL
jgi:IS30 family transposase